MMNVQQFLEDRHINFQTLEHEPTFSAQTLAAAVHVSGDEVAKTVLLSTDGGYVLAVLPATHSVNIERVRQIVGAQTIELAHEVECGDCFPDCELGALPPFGSRYGLKTLIDDSLLADEEIVFEGNNHHQAIRMKREDYMAVESPLIGSFAH